MKRTIITTLFIVSFLIAGTSLAILYAKGVRIIPGDGTSNTVVGSTGLLATTSLPDGAKVIINGQLKTATDATINLSPGEYEVIIEKEGYFPWKKKIIIKKEEVSRADALLFPVAPKLENITNTGAENPITDFSETLIAYKVSSASAQKNGIYVLNMSASAILGIGNPTTQIANNQQDVFSNSQLEFSPDGAQLLASISAPLRTSVYQLSAKELNTNLQNISGIVSQTKTAWRQEQEQDLELLISVQNKTLPKLIRENFKNPVFSPEHDRILYEASASATLPLVIEPRLIGVNSTAEQRNIKEKNLYVYDIKEDRNYLVFDSSSLKKNEARPKFLWHPFSKHLIFIRDKKIQIMEYDGQNQTTVYTGPFVDNFVAPWPDGSSLVILTNLNSQETPYNLYRLSLK